mgnify:CR=1 FL=1
MAKKNQFKPDKPYSGFWGKLLLTRLQQRHLLKWALYALVLVMLSVVQDVLLCRVRIFGASTDLVPCGIFLICVLEGMERGSVFAFVSSLIYLFSGTSPGIYVVVLVTALAVLVTWFRVCYLQRGFGAAMLCTAAAILLYEVGVYAVSTFLGQSQLSWLGSFCLTALMTVPFAPVLYPVVKAIGGEDTWKE